MFLNRVNSLLRTHLNLVRATSSSRKDRRVRRKDQSADGIGEVQILETRNLMTIVAAATHVQLDVSSTEDRAAAPVASHQQGMAPAGHHANGATPPTAVTSSVPVLTATAISSTQVKLTWTAPSSEYGFFVLISKGGDWDFYDLYSSGTRTAIVSGLHANTTYSFLVGIDDFFCDKVSAARSVTTLSNSSITIDHPTAVGSYSNVTGTLFGSGGPKYTDVHQGVVGDCWLLSGLAAVAARYPSEITSMFTSAGTAVENGQLVNLYKVRFYDNSGKAQYITVDTELPQSGKYYDQVTNGVLWVALAEKAYVQANAKGYVTTQHVGQDSYVALEGGMASWAVHAITGQRESTIAINPAGIASAWRSGQIICLCSSASANDNLIIGNSRDGNHVYAVIGYNSNSNSPFELYNPWGDSSTLNGTIQHNGHVVYGGAFYASASLISHDFGFQWISSQSQTAFGESRDGDSGTFVVEQRRDFVRLANLKK